MIALVYITAYGWTIISIYIQTVFLQLKTIDRNVYVTPREASLNVVWK